MPDVLRRLADHRLRDLAPLSIGWLSLTVLYLVWLTGTAAGQGPGAATAVVATPVVERELAASETFVGTVVAKRRSTIGCAVDGRVLAFYVDEGDEVQLQTAATPEEGEPLEENGQPIAQLRTRTLEIEIAAAQAQADLRDGELKQMQQSLPELLAQAQAARGTAEAKREFANAEFKRISGLFQRNQAVAESEMDAARAVAAEAQQSYLAADSVVSELEKTAELRLAQARARLLTQQEEVHRLEDLKLKYTIRAPFTGYVVSKFVEVGQWVKQGDPVAEVVELDPVEVELPVPAIYVDRIQRMMSPAGQEGLVVDVWVDALPDQAFAGRVTRIVPDADTRSRSFPVKVEVSNPRDEGHRIKPGMLARVSLAVGQPKRMLLVPKDALVLGGRSPMVYVVSSQAGSATALPIAVETGAAFGAMIEIRGQLAAGDLVVTQGNERLRPGQQVRLLESVSPQ